MMRQITVEPMTGDKEKEDKRWLRGTMDDARSEAAIRQRLTEAGLNGAYAAVSTHTSSDGQMFMAMVMVMVYAKGRVISI